MGREIRRVPPNWEHPKTMATRLKRGQYVQVEEYQPMYDEDFATRMEEWYAGWKAWGDADRAEHKCEYWEYEGDPPDPKYYRPAWPEGSATWYQVYETVSEGSPVTPPFATREELITYLSTKGDFWDQSRGDPAWPRKAAESFVGEGWAPSMVAVRSDAGVQIYTAATGFPDDRSAK